MTPTPIAWMRTSAPIIFAGLLVCCGQNTTWAPDPVSQLAVAPQSLTLVPDDSAPLTATASSTSGGSMATRIAWTSSDTSIIRVSPSGEVRALRQGAATITARAGTRTASASVRASFPPLAGVRLYAHRGFGAVYPENTLVAADSALAHGADGIEADVQLTSDSVPVIIHDATVDRTTNGSGAVASLTIAQIRALDACSKKGPRWAPCQIPLAEEMIQRVKDRALLILDLKGSWTAPQLQRLFAIVRRYGMLGTTLVTSFEMSYLRPVRQVDPRIAIGWLKSAPTDPMPVLALGNAAVFVDESVLRQNASTVPAYDSLLVSHGSLLGAFTIHNASVVPTLRSLGVRWYVSDIPLDKTALGAP